MNENKKINKRNYIRRKKYLNDSANQIKATLKIIQAAKGEPFTEQNLQRIAYSHAQAIEAVCWSPHSKLSAEGYQKLMNAKTTELCHMFLKKSFSDLNHLSQHQKVNRQSNAKDNDTMNNSSSKFEGFSNICRPERPQTPQPSLPIPIIPQSAPVTSIEPIFPDTLFPSFEVPDISPSNSASNDLSFDPIDMRIPWTTEDDNTSFFQNVTRYDDQYQY